MASEETPRATETKGQTIAETVPAPAPAVAAPSNDYKPYQPYSYPPEYRQTYQPYPGRTVVPSKPNRGWEALKTGIHIFIIILSIAGLGVGLSLVENSNARTVILTNVPVLGVALLWSLAEIIIRVIRKFKTGIHPGFHIAASLIIWLAVVILAAVFGFCFRSLGFERRCGFPRYGFGRDGFFNGSRGDCRFGSVNSETARAIAATAFTYTVAVLYFILFIGACVEVIRRNSATARPVAVVAPAATRWWQNWRPSLKDEKKPEHVEEQKTA